MPRGDALHASASSVAVRATGGDVREQIELDRRAQRLGSLVGIDGIEEECGDGPGVDMSFPLMKSDRLLPPGLPLFVSLQSLASLRSVFLLKLHDRPGLLLKLDARSKSPTSASRSGQSVQSRTRPFRRSTHSLSWPIPCALPSRRLSSMRGVPPAAARDRPSGRLATSRRTASVKSVRCLPEFALCPPRDSAS